jgi:rhodanese-related sulfurtransferase
MNTVTAHELQRLKGDNPNIPIVNTLSREDFRNKHIPDSFNIPVSS